MAARALACAASAPSTAEGNDRGKMLEMLPCKSAALRLCDRSLGIHAAAPSGCAVQRWPNASVNGGSVAASPFFKRTRQLSDVGQRRPGQSVQYKSCRYRLPL